MPLSIELPQPVKELIAAIPQSAEWFALGVCGVVLITLLVVLLIGRRYGTSFLYFFLIIGIIILSYDLYSKRQDNQSWAEIYSVYSPHFASEILITFLAVAILERSIARRERRHQVRRNAAGGLRFFVRFCEERDLHFMDQHRYLLQDEIAAFNSRKGKWIKLMSGKERESFIPAAEAANNLVTAISDYLSLPANTPEKETMMAIVDNLNTLRRLYQEFRTKLWLSSDPDEV